jgi:predicted metal-dependent peptidase
MPRRPPASREPDPATQQFLAGMAVLQAHPLFAPLLAHAHVLRAANNRCPYDAWAVVTNNGAIHVHPTRRGEAIEWTYVLAHCLLHLGFGHFVEKPQPGPWNAACDLQIDRFLSPLKLGRPPAGFVLNLDVLGNGEERLYEALCSSDQLEYYHGDLMFEPPRRWANPPNWQHALGVGLIAAVTSAVDVAGGRIAHLGDYHSRQTPAQMARSWFISSYPLLGALAAAFTIIENPQVCIQLSITVAAVDMERCEIYMNPAAGLDEAECRFVMAHELLHVGLRHDIRRQGRDPFLWNVACDYVINGWLVEMGLGHLPHIGGLYDPALKGESAEAIYDLMATDMRRYRRLATLRGVGLGDMLEPGTPAWWTLGDGTDLDQFYRQSLAQGLLYHGESGRGFLPGDLIEEIRALSQPPVPWDVELARWFDEHFPPLTLRRSYARPSRRQSSTPDIPRPRYVPHDDADEGRTFGVVLDTSGSMGTELLGKALGAIASYSISHDVPAVRVVFCDAVAYDQGYMLPEAIAGSVRVRGRGGTVLQPGITLLEQAVDFPENGPLLIITDGYCDKLQVRREHAFILPQGQHLPFVPRGPVFRIV